MLHCHTVPLPRGALLIPCTVCGTGEEVEARLQTVGGACVLIDSEVLHRGASSAGRDTWTTSCTVQLCSTSGWCALGELICQEVWNTALRAVEHSPLPTLLSQS